MRLVFLVVGETMGQQNEFAARGGSSRGKISRGAALCGALSFMPMGYARGQLFTTFASFDPPSTPAIGVSVVTIRHLYVNIMVEAEDREPGAHNSTGFVRNRGWTV